MSRLPVFRRVLLALCLILLVAQPALADGPDGPRLGPPPSLPPRPIEAVAQADTAGCTDAHCLYLPLTRIAGQPALWTDTRTRAASLAAYRDQYLASEGIAEGWTGNLTACNPGTTSAAFKNAVLRRIDYFRAMAGVPATAALSADYSRQAQAAALMMSANGQLSHQPPTSWKCYTAEGGAAAGHSNLALGADGTRAIDLYMRDSGSNNAFAGHRRWLLYPQTREMGTGDVPGGQGGPAANALKIFDGHTWDPRPSTRDPFVAWPPPGFVPYPVVYARWSFAYAGANFSSATVTMSAGGASVPVTLEPQATGYGENTLVWRPSNMDSNASWPRPQADTTYTVNVRHVVIAGQSRDFTYAVTIFDPG